MNEGSKPGIAHRPRNVGRRPKWNQFSILGALVGTSIMAVLFWLVPPLLVPKTELTGKVTLDGKPLADGVLTLLPQQAGTQQPIQLDIANGVYAIFGGLKPGDYVVKINASRLQGKLSVELIPEKYNRNSALHIVLRTGHNIVDFDLVSD
ncbi:MAG: carboxypeptidase-like regulatory domain-containing protein [bacterium]|nr:carboxypeptidase-like regulatory domain-containing protein [bacterium]